MQEEKLQEEGLQIDDDYSCPVPGCTHATQYKQKRSLNKHLNTKHADVAAKYIISEKITNTNKRTSEINHTLTSLKKLISGKNSKNEQRLAREDQLLLENMQTLTDAAAVNPKDVLEEDTDDESSGVEKLTNAKAR